MFLHLTNINLNLLEYKTVNKLVFLMCIDKRDFTSDIFLFV